LDIADNFKWIHFYLLNAMPKTHPLSVACNCFLQILIKMVDIMVASSDIGNNLGAGGGGGEEGVVAKQNLKDTHRRIFHAIYM